MTWDTTPHRGTGDSMPQPQDVPRPRTRRKRELMSTAHPAGPAPPVPPDECPGGAGRRGAGGLGGRRDGRREPGHCRTRRRLMPFALSELSAHMGKGGAGALPYDGPRAPRRASRLRCPRSGASRRETSRSRCARHARSYALRRHTRVWPIDGTAPRASAPPVASPVAVILRIAGGRPCGAGRGGAGRGGEGRAGKGR